MLVIPFSYALFAEGIAVPVFSISKATSYEHVHFLLFQIYTIKHNVFKIAAVFKRAVFISWQILMSFN